jgi:hypothetical protein
VDPIRLALLAMGAGVAFGVAVISATTFGVAALKSTAPAAAPATGGPLYLLFFGTLAGLVLAGAVAWRLLSPVRSTYRRGGLSVVSGLATVLPMWLCVLVNQAVGRTGLAGLGVGALALSILLARGARRAAVAA